MCSCIPLHGMRNYPILNVLLECLREKMRERELSLSLFFGTFCWFLKTISSPVFPNALGTNGLRGIWFSSVSSEQKPMCSLPLFNRNKIQVELTLLFFFFFFSHYNLAPYFLALTTVSAPSLWSCKELFYDFFL